MKRLLCFVFLLFLPSLLMAADKDKNESFGSESFTAKDGRKMPYRLLKPENLDKAKKYPVVLFLHGWGERGTDNQKQLIDIGPFFTKEKNRSSFPCFVIVPQANGSWVERPVFDKPIRLSKKPTANLTMAVEIVSSVEKKYKTDPSRLYVMGYSNGACGVWELLERIPQKIAAAAIMAGAGDPSTVVAAKGVPIWAFHGDKDVEIPIARMMELTAALKAAHGTPM